MVGICAYCHEDLDKNPTYIEGILEGKALDFCNEECCKEYLFYYADIVELDSPDYEPEY